MGSGTFVYRLTDGDDVTYTEDEAFVRSVVEITRTWWPPGEAPPLRVECAYHKGWEDYED
jgi:hypothetical protein